MEQIYLPLDCCADGTLTAEHSHGKLSFPPTCSGLICAPLRCFVPTSGLLKAVYWLGKVASMVATGDAVPLLCEDNGAVRGRELGKDALLQPMLGSGWCGKAPVRQSYVAQDGLSSLFYLIGYSVQCSFPMPSFSPLFSQCWFSVA